MECVMTGDQLKRWRENRNLSQQELATYLGENWTRDMVANREADRATMPENIDQKLSVVDEQLARKPAPNAADREPARKPKRDYGKHFCWRPNGERISMADVLARPKGFYFIRLDNPTKDKDPLTGHQIANLWQTSHVYPNGECTYIHVDIVTWTAHCSKFAHDPKNKEGVEWLDKTLAGKRASLAEAYKVAAESGGIFEIDPTGIEPSKNNLEKPSFFA